MTDTWVDESAEYFGGNDGAEWYEDGAGEYVDFGDGEMFGDAVRGVSVRRREDDQRVAARRRALEIQRRAQAARSRTPARPVTTTAAIRNTRAAVRNVDLENRVRADAFDGAIGAVRTRSTGLERTASAAALGDTIKNELDSFELDLGEELTNALKTVVDFAPLVFLRSPEKGLRNPPVLAGLTGVGIAITGLIIRRIRADGAIGGGGGGVDLVRPRAGQQPTK